MISLERAHIPYALCPEIEKKFDFSQESLYSVLREKYTLQLVIAQQTVEARKPTIEEMRKLAIEQADPVLSFERTTLNAKSQPVEFARSVYLGDRYKLRVQLKPTSSSVQGEGPSAVPWNRQAVWDLTR